MRRGVPDISAVADPETGYRIFLYDEVFIIGGTSAVAPLLAAMNAVMNEEIGKNINFFLQKIYKAKSSSFNDIVSGDNGKYKAVKGWDACTGLGTPVGMKLIEDLKKS